MLNKCLILIALCTVFTVSIPAAAVVTCGQPGFSQTVYNGTCVVGTNAGGTLEFSGVTSSSTLGDVFTVQALAEVLTTPKTNAGPYPMTASATWDDIFEVPSSNPTDIFTITVTGGGLNHPAAIYAGPITYSGTDFCDARYVGNSVCTESVNISAGDFSSLEIKGSDSVSIGGPCGYSDCGLSVNSELYELVTVQRFLADGVTADPFTVTPEPSSLALLLVGIPAGLVFLRRR